MELNTGLFHNSPAMDKAAASEPVANDAGPQLKLVSAPSVDQRAEPVPEEVVARDARYIASIAATYRRVADEMHAAAIGKAA